jgi:hypothetical protein
MRTLIKLSVVALGMVFFASCDPKPKDGATDADTTAVNDEAVESVDGTAVDTVNQAQDSATIDTTQNTK